MRQVVAKSRLAAVAQTSRLLLLIALFMTTGCSTYYSLYYQPSQEVQKLSVAADEQPVQEVAQVTTSIVGILRAEDDLPRRVHARIAVENSSNDPLELLISKARLTPAGEQTLDPDEGAEAVTITSGETRKIDLTFSLPPKDVLPTSRLKEFELAWALQAGGRVLEGRSSFRQGYPYRYYPGPYYYPPPYYGPYWFGPYAYCW